jgi:hypothetical protein
MDVITMPSTHLRLLNQLKRDYPNINFNEDEDFAWSPLDKTISYNPYDPQATALTLHELAHAVLGHGAYKHDIELIAIERAAWDYAKITLGPLYNHPIDEDFAEDTLNTYRDWLHARSTCPNCGATGLQIKQREYKCLACEQTWRVNEARSCELRRYTKKTR